MGWSGEGKATDYFCGATTARREMQDAVHLCRTDCGGKGLEGERGSRE